MLNLILNGLSHLKDQEVKASIESNVMYFILCCVTSKSKVMAVSQLKHTSLESTLRKIKGHQQSNTK